MRLRTLGLAGATALALAGLTVPAYAADDDKATVYVLHGVPDTPVDVYAGGERIINDFQPGKLGGPLSLDPGDVEIAITAADAEDDSEPVIGPATVSVEGGKNYTVVAHLEENGDPTATAFENDVSDTPAGQGRLTVRHTAAAPAVDVLAGGDAVISDLTNPNEESLELDAGTVEASVAAAGTTDPVIGPADVTVSDGKLTVVYAWGSLDDDNLELAVQTLDTGHSSPGAVHAGEAGLAAEASLAPYAAAATGLLAAGLLVGRRRMQRSTAGR